MFVPPVFLFFQKPLRNYQREQEKREATAKALNESRKQNYADFIKTQNEYHDCLDEFEKTIREYGLYEKYMELRVKADKHRFASKRFNHKV